MFLRRLLEFVVGLFILAGIVAIFILAFKVSGFSLYSDRDSFHVMAPFDNIGDLKIRAPVTIAGVRVGEVKKIHIDPVTFKAKVTMLIDKRQKNLPLDSSASILTAGLIGSNYIEITPGFAEEYLKEDSIITETHPAIILENLIGQIVYQLKDDKKDNKEKSKKDGVNAQ
jgi:phospholipid/cholesterol/gamma-HCH transport system substrate-binding protein